MSDLDRLRALLGSGKLLHPVSDALSIVDFANALHSAMGVPGVPLGVKETYIKGMIGDPDHLILVLADGFGMNFVECLERGAFMRSHLRAEMRTVFPSTTPIALTTLATGQWPGKHSVIGWFLRLDAIEAVSTIISYVRTSDKRPLSELGIEEVDAYPAESRIGRASREALHLMPEHLTGSTYSNYWTGAVSQTGYDPEVPGKAMETIIDCVRRARERTCVYLYLPHVDSLAHKRGASHEETLRAAAQVDGLLEKLSEGLPGNARIVVTADHGHLDAPPEQTYSIGADDRIAELCSSLTGDPRAAYAHVADEMFDAFREAVRGVSGDDFLVLRSSDVEDLGLLCPGTVSDEARRRMGDALVLSTGGAALDYRALLGDEVHPMVSHHGGLTPEEMRIPLVVA